MVVDKVYYASEKWNRNIWFSYFPSLLLLQSELNLETDLMVKAFATSTNAVTTVRRVIARSSFCN
jgi:hypothetical protein